jgi:hypothetical protein
MSLIKVPKHIIEIVFNDCVLKSMSLSVILGILRSSTLVSDIVASLDTSLK